MSGSGSQQPQGPDRIKKEDGDKPVGFSSLGALGMGRLKNSSRLPSFLAPRDLTLSSLGSTSSLQSQATRTKKTFVPNIPQRRNKGEKIVESKSEKSNKPQNKTGSERGGRGRGRGKEKVYVQARGALFGEGIAAGPRRPRSYGGGGGGDGSRTSAEVQRPVLNLDAAYEVDKEHEEKRLKELLRDDFIDDDDEGDLRPAPILLPTVKAPPKGEIGGPNPKTTVKVKKERSLSEDGDETATLDSKVELDGSASKGSDSAAEALSKPDQSDLLFFQLPSSLPGHPSEGGDDASAHSSQPAGSAAAGEVSSSRPCSLSTLPEGRIGSLKIRESGRVTLNLGEHTLLVDVGTEVGFLQKAVRIQTDEESRTGSMTCLGRIGNRFVTTPDFERLVNRFQKMT